jgi:hypothetical protein
MHAGERSGDKRGTAATGLTPEPQRPRLEGDLADALFDSQPPVVRLPLPDFQFGQAAAAASSSPEHVVVVPEQDHKEEIADLKRIVAQQASLLERVIAMQEAARHPPPGLDRMEVDADSRGRPAAGSTTAAPCATAAPRKLKFKPSSAVASRMTSLAAKFKRKLIAVAKSRARMEKFEESLKALKEGAIPTGYKPFACPWEGAEWQSLVGMNDLSSLIVSAAPGHSLEQVARRLYVENLASNIVLQNLAESIRLKALLDETKLDVFILECREAAMLEKVSFLAVTSEPVLSDELWGEILLDVEHEARQLYLGQVKKVAVDNMQIEEKKKKQKEAEAKALEEAAKLPEAEVWRRGLKEVLGSKKGNKFAYDKLPDVVSFAKLLNLEVKNDVDFASATKPKNGLTPGGGRGQNLNTTQNVPNPKGKGKGKAQPKTKIVPDGKGKGKGKGKTKEKQPQQKGGGKGQPAPKKGAWKQSQSKGKGKGKKGQQQGKGDHFKGR